MLSANGLLPRQGMWHARKERRVRRQDDDERVGRVDQVPRCNGEPDDGNNERTSTGINKLRDQRREVDTARDSVTSDLKRISTTNHQNKPPV